MKKVKAIQLTTSGKCQFVTISDYRDLNKYADCQVGTIVTTMSNHNLHVWIDDEGLLLQKQINPNAVTFSEYPGPLVGNAVIFRSDKEGDNADLTSQDVEFIEKVLKVTIQESEE